MRLCEKLQERVGDTLEQWLLTGEDLPPNDKAISEDSFGFYNLGQREVLLAANGSRAEMLLNILRHTGQLP